MISLEINPSVLATLKQHFPKPTNSAQRALDKYVRVLEAQLNECVLNGRSAYQRKLDFYTISLYKQRNGGGQIGPNKIRFQNWLETNNLELFKVVELGTNYNKQLTTIKLSPLVTIRKTAISALSALPEQSHADQISDQQKSSQTLFEQLFPEVEELSPDEIKQLFDIVQINQQSLKHYIHWLKTGSTLLKPEQREHYLEQAERIQQLTDHADGFLFQRKKPSKFGRIYYDGISVQNINKELRRAILGPCWEHDIRSSVFTWKMCYAKDCYQLLDTEKTLNQIFSATISFLRDKKEFMASVRYMTFLEDTRVPRDLQSKLIKRAITAIGFGARVNGSGKMLKNSEWMDTSLAQIIKNKTELQRFISCPLIKDFIREQKILDAVIFHTDKGDTKAFFDGADVHTQSGRLSQSKVIAFMYQHYETQLMDLIHKRLEAKGKTVIARIHDAIITREKLSLDDRDELMWLMRDATENPYWHISSKQLLPYEAPQVNEPQQEDTRERQNWFRSAMGKLFG
jgi:hypothetical protein